jgi:hypothetical protein
MLFLSFQCYWGALHHCRSLPGYVGSIQWSPASAYSWLSGPSSCGGFTSLQRLHGSIDLRGNTDGLRLQHLFSQVQEVGTSVCLSLQVQEVKYEQLQQRKVLILIKNSVIVRTRFLVHFWTTFVNLMITVSERREYIFHFFCIKIDLIFSLYWHQNLKLTTFFSGAYLNSETCTCYFLLHSLLLWFFITSFAMNNFVVNLHLSFASAYCSFRPGNSSWNTLELVYCNAAGSCLPHSTGQNNSFWNCWSNCVCVYCPQFLILFLRHACVDSWIQHYTWSIGISSKNNSFMFMTDQSLFGSLFELE